MDKIKTIKEAISNYQKRYSIRKLTVGTTSVLLGAFLVTHNTHHTAHAATIVDPKKVVTSVTHNNGRELELADDEVQESTSSTESQQAEISTTQSNAVVEETSEKTPTSDPQTEKEEAKEVAKVKKTTPTSKGDTWKIDSSNSKVYDGIEVNKVDVTNIKELLGSDLDTTSITDTSFQWVDKDGIAIGDTPKDVGTYYAQLTADALKQLKEANPNLSDADLDKIKTFTFNINQSQATAKLRGVDSKSDSDVENKKATINSDRIYVEISAPDQKADKYELQDGDYEWYSDDFDDETKIDTAPVSEGTYYIKLTEQGKDNVQKKIDAENGSGLDPEGKAISNVKVNFEDSAATYYVYDDDEVKKPANLPKDTVWTPAGWTRANPDYVAKSAEVHLYNAENKNFPSESNKEGNPLKPKDNSFTYTAFGTEITKVIINKEDMKIGNRILLATITATNDYAKTSQDQLPLSVASSENGRKVTTPDGKTTWGFLEVNQHDNGEIDIWLNVTNTDTYADDITLEGFQDTQTGYINYKDDFDKISNLTNNNGKKLKVGDTLTQTISTVSQDYTQEYKIGSIGRGVKNIPGDGKPTVWQSPAEPTFSANYTNPALGLTNTTAPSIQKLVTNNKGITPQSYYKVYSIQGDNIDFSGITTFVRADISPVDGEIKFEVSDVTTDENGNTTLIDKNKKQAIKLADNLSIKDLLAQTPDGQSAYSIQNGGVLVAIRVNPEDTQLTTDEIDNVVKHSQYYNFQSKKQTTLDNTQAFYEKIGYQPVRTAIMVKASLEDKDNHEGWGIIRDVTPDEVLTDGTIKAIAKAQNEKEMEYNPDKTSANPPVYRTINIIYQDEKGNKISQQAQTVVVKGSETQTNQTFNISNQLGYTLVSVKDKNSTDYTNKLKNHQFEKTILKNKQNTDVIVTLKQAENNPHTLTYTVVDTDLDDSVITDQTSLGVYVTDNGFNTEDPEYSSQEAANSQYNTIITGLENQGYEIVDKTTPTWESLKDYNVIIKVKHGTTEVTSENDWPTYIADDQKQDLNKTITRTIQVEGLPGIGKGTTQEVTFTRTAAIDKITKKVTYMDWTSEKANWDAFDIDPHEGFEVDKITVDGTIVSKEDIMSDNSTVKSQTVSTSTPNTTIVVTYKDTRGKAVFEFIDIDDNNKVIASTPVTGRLGETSIVKLDILENYVLADNEKLPTDHEFNTGVDDPKEDITTIRVKHRIDNINLDNIPDDAKDSVGNKVTKDNFSQTVTRTITITDPYEGDSDHSQHVELTRTGTIDAVTHQVTYGDWTENTFEVVSVPIVEGYTASGTISEDVANDGYVDPKIHITYTANPQSITYTFVDDMNNGATVKDGTLKGVTDQTINPSSDLASVLNSFQDQGYKLADGQNIPTNYKFGVNNPVIKIHLTHAMTEPIKPGDKIPAGANLTEADLSKTVTRKVIIIDPNNKLSTQTQDVVFIRSAVIDTVTGKAISYDNWTTSNTTLSEVTAPSILGYTPSNKAERVTDVKDTDNFEDVVITYTADQQSVTYRFVDDDKQGSQVGSDITFDGVTGQTKEFDGASFTVPDNYELVTSLPESYTFLAKNNPVQLIHLKHKVVSVTADTADAPKDDNGNYIVDPSSLTKTVTRTVHYQDEDGNSLKADTVQTAIFKGETKVDLVTKETASITWKASEAQGSATINSDNATITFGKVTSDPISKDGKTWTTNDEVLENTAINHSLNSYEVTLKFTKDINATITFLDITSGKDVELNQLTDKQKHGKAGEAINFDNLEEVLSDYLNQDYVLISNDFNNQVYGEEDSNFSIRLAKKAQHKTDSKTITRTVKFVDKMGQNDLLPASQKQTVTYQKDYYVDQNNNFVNAKQVTDANGDSVWIVDGQNTDKPADSFWKLVSGSFDEVNDNLDSSKWLRTKVTRNGHELTNKVIPNEEITDVDNAVNQEYVIYYTHKLTDLPLEAKKHTRTINYYDADTGKKLADELQTVTYERIPVKDEVTGQIIGYRKNDKLITDQDEAWKLTNGIFVEVKSPDLTGRGYKAELSLNMPKYDKQGSGNVIAQLAATPDMEDSVVYVYYFHDTEPVSEQAKVTHRIDYLYANGTKANQKVSDRKTKTITYTRKGIKDKVTGKIIYENNGQWFAKDNFEDITSPVVDSYHVDQAMVKAPKIDFASLKDGANINFSDQVNYTIDHQDAVITYIDDSTGQKLKTDHVTGYSNDPANYSTSEIINGYLKDHYILVSDDTLGKDLTFDNNKDQTQNYEVHLKHATNVKTKNYTVTRKITYRGSRDGGKTYKELSKQTQSVTFSRYEVIDQVTGELLGYDINNDGLADSNASDGWMVDGKLANNYEFKQIISKQAEDEGYTVVDKDNVAAKTVTPDSEDNEDVVVTYNYYVPSQFFFYDDTANTELLNLRMITDKRGVIGEKININIADLIKDLEDKGYKVVVDEFAESNQTYQDGDNRFEIHLRHKQTDQAVETIQRQRKINYYDAQTGEKIDDETQTVTYERIPVKDEVTGQIVGYRKDGKIIPDKDQAWRHKFGFYAALPSPDLTKYGYKGTPSFDKEKDNGDAASAPINTPDALKDGEEVNIYYFHDTESINEQATVTHKITYRYENGPDTGESKTKTITYTRKGIKDKVTGEIIYENGGQWLADGSFEDVSSPIRPGYRPDKELVNGLVISPEDLQPGSNHIEDSFVTYYADSSSGVADDNKATIDQDIALAPDEVIIVKPKESSDPALVVEDKDKVEITDTETNKAEQTKSLAPEKQVDTIKVKNNTTSQTIYKTKAANPILAMPKSAKTLNTQQQVRPPFNEEKLPQTGQRNNIALSVIGLAAIALGGLLGTGKKKKRD